MKKAKTAPQVQEEAPAAAPPPALFRIDIRHKVVAAVLALGFALAQLRILAIGMGANLGRSIDAAAGVMNGHPHWRVYQSRVLGPFLVQRLSDFCPSFEDAHIFYLVVTLAIAGYLMLVLTWKLTQDVRTGILTFLGLQALLALLVHPLWFYAWDPLDLIGFTLFNFFVLSRKGWRWFAALFAALIFSRESAYFIAAWMVADPLLRWWNARRASPTSAALDRAALAAGLVCLIAGPLIVEALRSALLVEEMGPKLFVDAQKNPGQYVQFTWFQNLQIAKDLLRGSFNPDLIVLTVIPAVITLAVMLIRRRPTRSGWPQCTSSCA